MMRSFFVGVAFLLVASAAGAQERMIEVSYERFTLPNGLNVILHRDVSTPMVTVNLWYNVGSGREKVGRTGFAHLFEHILFEGSENVPEGMFDEWLEAAGGNNNGSTNTDRTNYYEDLPRNALELALFLESDRMGHLLDAMSPDKVDGQRDVVKNERRQSYENRPYGMASLALDSAMYPASHPYSWPMIGSMEDLSAASYEDVVEFFQVYYAPNNASLSIAGDIDLAETRKLVEHWFSDVAGGKPVPPIEAPPAVLTAEKRMVLEDRVQLPRMYMCWLTPPIFAPGDAEMDVVGSVLAGGKNARLYKRLVYDMQIAQDVYAYQGSGEPLVAVLHRHHGAGRSRSGRAGGGDPGGAGAAPDRAAHRAGAPACREPDRGVVPRPARTDRRVRRQGRPVERLLLAHRQPRLVRRGSGALQGARAQGHLRRGIDASQGRCARRAERGSQRQTRAGGHQAVHGLTRTEENGYSRI